MEDGTTRELAQVRRIGIVAQMVDPADPSQQFKVPIDERAAGARVRARHGELHRAACSASTSRSFLANSVFVTVVATLITLLINSMAAFALSKYEFPGQNAAMLMVIGTLMVPLSIILVPLYLVVTALGLFNSLWGVILPTARRRPACSCCASTC